MYTIKTMNAISPVGLVKLPAGMFEIDNDAAEPQGILVRSADMHEAPLAGKPAYHCPGRRRHQQHSH